MELPKDPAMLLSIVNMQLRDKEPDLKMLAGKFSMSEEEIKARLGAIGYEYDPEVNQFV
ncbi:DUF4250 domain-containing protein [Candidatus Weimeria sp. HCP3S3_B5]|uniref:DUF4250 domain-containing protein n=1 Tax=Candidatus Weimeria sp. HCP3S3_B5 TaxID=3438871 RepID=UPI002A93F9CB|nr:DUF4250 domain-containing protein [Lachnospiraceae bacterium]MDY6352269.1 DUF4250 domain-containing protein [Lachnospiraceae bacterium]